MGLKEDILSLVVKLIEDIDSPTITLSAIVRRAIRIAKLRDDYDNLLWLELEMVSKDDDESRLRLATEFMLHYSKEEYRVFRSKIITEFASERSCRTISEDGIIRGIVCGRSISEIENDIETVTQPLQSSVIDAVCVEGNLLLSELHGVLGRIRQRVYRYLLDVEQQMRSGNYTSQMFERNLEYIRSRLAIMAPPAIEQLDSIQEHSGEATTESRSLALLSCRRLLKSMADKLYPARDAGSSSAIGKSRDLSEDKYINRLWAYITDKVSAGRARELLVAQASDIGNRLDSVYNLSSQGVHASISETEMLHCVMQTYLLIGDILRLSEATSAAGSEDSAI